MYFVVYSEIDFTESMCFCAEKTTNECKNGKVLNRLENISLLPQFKKTRLEFLY